MTLTVQPFAHAFSTLGRAFLTCLHKLRAISGKCSDSGLGRLVLNFFYSLRGDNPWTGIQGYGDDVPNSYVLSCQPEKLMCITHLSHDIGSMKHMGAAKPKLGGHEFL